jgi:hypothetical protein
LAYAYNAAKNTISDGDAKNLIRISELISDWNSIASQFVVISRKFVSANPITESDLSLIDTGAKSLFKIQLEMESYFNNIDDDGVFMFFREIHKLYYEMSLEYVILKNSIQSKDYKEYGLHSSKLVEFAVLKSKTLRHFNERLNSINESGVKYEFREFLTKWGVNQDVKIESGEK